MTVWVVIAFIVLVVVGSVVWIRPSPRDQKLALWRRDAIMAGLKVRMQTLKAEPKQSGIRDEVEGVSYEWYVPKVDKQDQFTWAVVKTNGWLTDGLPEGWSWYESDPEKGEAFNKAVSQLIDECPVEVNALERTPRSSRIMWSENGKEFDAPSLKRFLEKLQATS